MSAEIDFNQRIPQLDGIRGTAILTVIIYHWLIVEGHDVLPRFLYMIGAFGWSGVDLFFVLSGFLIGGILLDNKNADNYFKVFYIRRFFRILPLYLLVCLISVFVYYSNISTHKWLFEDKIPWYAYLSFAQNVWMTYFNAMSSRMIDATWSLAVEEQFYFTLPLVIRFVKDKWLPYVLICGIMAAPLIRILLFFSVAPDYRLPATYLLMPCRMDALLLGVLITWGIRQPSVRQWLFDNKLLLNITFAVLFVGFAVIIFRGWNLGTLPLSTFGFTWIALFYSSLLVLSIVHRESIFSRLFQLKFLTGLGILAYGLYLFHQPVLGIINGVFNRESPKLTSLSALALTFLSVICLILLSKLSWKYFEKPLVKIGHKYKYKAENNIVEMREEMA